MKNPLHYQLTEYDCGPTSLLNAISFLFEREEIPPEVIRNIIDDQSHLLFMSLAGKQAFIDGAL